ncbi:MAG: glycosyl hydrolase [Melioribacteraceae bacterium]|nr:glycosyl hydrolase [Melioribacteraceae bacterium]
MKKKVYRIFITIAVLLTGFLLVLLITFMGKKTSGPIEDLFYKIRSGITSIEDHFILGKREKTRSKSLKWFDYHRFDKSRILSPDKLLLGAYDDKVSDTFQPIVDLEDSIKTVFPIIHIYTAWGSKRDQQFPSGELNAIYSIGSLPMITWEPWLTDFDKDLMPGLPDKQFRDNEGLKAIARGVYDSYINKWASDAKSFNKLFFLRLAHEMNDPYRYPWGPQNNQPEDFIAAWKYIVNRFKMIGADNVIWVWSPHPAYGRFEEYYPGREFVDWIGVGTLNYGTVAPWSKWWTFDEIFAKHYEVLAQYNKPIIISEFGSLAVGGDRSKWFEEALKDFDVKYPSVKALIFFHCSSDATTTYQTLNWYLKDDQAVTKKIVNSIRNLNITF